MSRNNGHKRIITRHKDIKGGRPCVKGTRISVDDVVRATKNNRDINFIADRVKSFGISKSDIQHVLDYAKAKSG